MSTNLLKALSIIAFIISGLFTIMLMTSAIVGIIATILTIGIAVILELCKCTFFYFGVNGQLNGRKIPSIIRIVCFFIAIALFVSSIIASLSFLQNNNNKTKNYALESSQEAQNKTANIKAQDDLIQTKKAEIATLNTSLKNLEKTSKDSIKDLRSRNLITKANNLQEQTNKEIDNITNKINKANNELSALTGNLQTIRNKEVKADMSNTKGYTAFLKVIADKLNESPERKDHPISSDEIETWFFGILSVIFEFVAVLLFYFSLLAKEEIPQENNKPIPYSDELIGSDNITVNQIDKDYSPLDDQIIKPKKTIGFYNDNTIKNIDTRLTDKIPENKYVLNTSTIVLEKPLTIDKQIDVTQEENFNLKPDILKYLNYMYKNIKENNYSPGKRDIKTATKLQYRTIDLIWEQLEKLNIVKVELVNNVKKTKVLKGKNEAIKLINKHF